MLSRWFAALLPVLDWGARYRAEDFRADLVAGVVVLFITVPQVIAYAFLAGLPAETGLYAALMALLGYAAFGSSRTLAVGPTAILAMMTLETTSGLQTPGTVDYNLLATKLALLTGVVLIVLRIINFGAVVSFLSHTVVTGFITASAILIITNQVPLLLGMTSSSETAVVAVMQHVVSHLSSTNLVAAGIGLASIGLLWFCRTRLESLLLQAGLSPQWISSLVKSAPMYAVVLSILAVWGMALDESAGVAVIGEIPSQLPSLAGVVMSWQETLSLLPSALLMAMVIFMESTSIGSAVASKRRQKIDPNQELVGLGVANVGASVLGGFPVAGSFSRTVVNFSAGAVTPVASLITAALLLVSLVGMAPLFYYLPKAVLSAIIVMSAIQLVDVHDIRRTFAFNRIDAVTFSCTFIAVLLLGVETGILAGIAVSFVLLIRSSSKPHIAVVGRVGDSEHFRNVLRYDVKTSPEVLAVRIDESLYFVNTRYVENFLLNQVADGPQIRHVLLICTATNFIDSSGLEMLEQLQENLAEVGVTLHLAEVKSKVMDTLKHTDFYANMHGRVFLSTDVAMKSLAGI